MQGASSTLLEWVVAICLENPLYTPQICCMSEWANAARGTDYYIMYLGYTYILFVIKFISLSILALDGYPPFFVFTLPSFCQHPKPVICRSTSRRVKLWYLCLSYVWPLGVILYVNEL
ncbi:hypothetical protein BDQ12DRAFT_260551 [Crucibulum laeve]|uniref:Uncharacterized protein n=1 Tax=Crucibulum laeve TaxID=68775 RepID=A0A5C3LVM7_9AGAR|nr:hypothetical protein BDQ12DRAFT_260551 [Crucibulum laeve]